MNQISESIHVLHVDDSPDFAEMVATFLEREDDRFSVETATRASEGLDRLAENDFDCIVSDYDMPGKDGIEFLEAVREDHSALPFILFTGKGSEAVASDAISAGVTDYLQKEGGTDQYTILANRLLNSVERARAQRERQRHLDAIETAQEGISILDEDGQFIFVNEAYADLYGYHPEEMIGNHWELIYPDDDVPYIHEEILATVHETGHWHGETTGLRADGSTFTEDHILATTAHGELVCTVRDITDRKEREHDLSETNTVLRTILENLPEGILVEDASRNILMANESLCNILDVPVSPTDLVDRDCAHAAEELKEIFADPAGFITGIEEVIERRDPVWNEELALADGRILERDYVPYTHPDGDANLWIYRDITERRNLRQQYELVAQASTDAFWDWDPNTDEIARSDEYLTQFGYDESNVGSETDWWRNRIHPDDRDSVLAALEQAVAEPESTYDEVYRFRRADGTYGYLRTRGIAVYDETGKPTRMVGAHINISELMEARQQLERQNERLDEFASVVSHDLRNPLNVAQGRLELAQEECDSEHLADVASAHTRMESLIEDLLMVARVGDRVSDRESVDLAELLENCWRNVATAEATLGIETDWTIRADASRLQQLLENLMRNAVEHGGGGVTITVGDLADDRGFYVEDDGPGIPEDESEAVFERGYSTAEGTGFGLAIVKTVVEAHDWEISITDGGAGGTRFEITGVERD